MLTTRALRRIPQRTPVQISDASQVSSANRIIARSVAFVGNRLKSLFLDPPIAYQAPYQAVPILPTTANDHEDLQ